MIVQTYQSIAVLQILQSGKVYRAKPSISFKGQYAALIDILNLNCECPIFAVVKGKKQNTGGKVSGKVCLTLDVPDSFVHLTEYSVWADFMYAFKSSQPNDYRKLDVRYNEIKQIDYDAMIADLKQQRNLDEYEYPQVILEKIHPSWLKKHKIISKNSGLGSFFKLFKK